MTLQANLTNKDATRMPHPLVKWSYEPPRAEDVPHAIARGTYLASLPPRGPVFVSIPFDDWDAEVDEAAVAHQTRRQVTGRQGPDPARLGELVERLGKAKNPAMVAGPDIDMCGGWDAAVKFAEKLKLPVWATPAPGGGPARVPGEPPALPRHPAAGDRARRRDAEGVRPRARRRLVGLPLLPEHPRAAAGRGHAS